MAVIYYVSLKNDEVEFMSKSNIWSEEKAKPSIGSVIVSIVVYSVITALRTITIAALFNVIGLLLARFAPNFTFPAGIQTHITNLFTWGTAINIGVAAVLAVIPLIIGFFQKDEVNSTEKFFEELSKSISQSSKKKTLFSIIVSSIKHIFTIILTILHIMVGLHAFGLVFGIEQQPFVKGLFSFGSFANIFWPSLIVGIYFIAQFIKWLLYSDTLDMINEKIEMRRKIKKQQKQEAAAKAIADTEKRILDRFAEFGFDADYKFKYFSAAKKSECEGTVSLFASLVSKYPIAYGTAADYLRIIEAQETPEKLLEFASVYMTGRGEGLARYGVKTNYEV